MKKAERDARAARARAILGMTEETPKIEVEVGCPNPEPVPGNGKSEIRRPTKFAPGDLKVGDAVWYRDSRYWVEWIADDWNESVFVHLSSERIVPDRPATKTRIAVAVYADCIERAVVTKNAHTKQPTKADIQRKERSAEGKKDVGDPVAEMLREYETMDEIYWITAKLLNTPEEDLRAKYDHLNPGQRRMNCGNRLRGAYKKGLIKL